DRGETPPIRRDLVVGTIRYKDFLVETTGHPHSQLEEREIARFNAIKSMFSEFYVLFPPKRVKQENSLKLYHPMTYICLVLINKGPNKFILVTSYLEDLATIKRWEKITHKVLISEWNPKYF